MRFVSAGFGCWTGLVGLMTQVSGLAQPPIADSPRPAQKALSFYLENARQSSPLIRDNQNQLLGNALEAKRLQALYTKPLVQVTGAVQFAPIFSTDNGGVRPELNSKGASRYYGYDLAVSNGGLYQGLVNVTQPISNLFRAKAFAEPFVLASQIGQTVIGLGQHDVERIVTDQYILCLQDRLQVQYTDSLLRLLNEQRGIVQKFVESSLLKQSDLTLVDIETQTQHNLRVGYQTAYRRDILELNALSGLADTTLVDLAPLQLTLAADIGPLESGFTRRYALDSLALLAQQTIFELRYKPQWNFIANGGLNTSYLPDLPRRLGFSAGVSLVWTLYDGHQKRLNSQRTAILQQSFGNYRQFIDTQNRVRRERLLGELSGLAERLTVFRQQLTGYESVLSSYRRELLQGQLSIINYITVLKNMVAVRRDMLLLQSNRQLLINAYNYYNW
ncbi:TolC family protein [Larkinella sp. C7]|uniref:TolC family protein n=1 Tax=Larkinella sp. C7 TaxID=2576607 RepID=UPI001110FDA6|nr:TolC family protein [Larkinella sp. C7]